MASLPTMYSSLESGFDSPFGESTSSTRRASLRYAADISLGGSLGLTAGADVARESGRSTFIVDRGGAEIPVERTLAGYFADTMNLGGPNLTSGGAIDVVLARYDANGMHIWSRGYGDAASQFANRVTATAEGHLLVAGYSEGTVDFGLGPMTCAGSKDALIAEIGH